MIKNAQGKIWYGMHFYPGVAEYQEPGKDPYRVYLNENTIRSMDPTFAGRPIFVEHVDEVEEDLDELRKEADGWVIESFFNSADGKHWVKFIVVSELGEKAIKNRMRLSNAYVPLGFAQGGLWNGVAYAKEITGGEYEHLAIVKNPRYEESVIMTPEEFKKYNEDHVVELKRLSNSKEGETKMGFKLFKKTKVENQTDLEGMSVILPKSGKELTITQLVNSMDEMEEKKQKNDGLADMDHKVKLHDGSYCNVGELVAKHKALHDEMESMKKDEMEPESDLEMEGTPVDVESDVANEEDEKKKLKPAEEDEEIKDAKKKNSKESEIEVARKKAAKEKADRLRLANSRQVKEETYNVDLSGDQVARGKSRYGSK